MISRPGRQGIGLLALLSWLALLWIILPLFGIGIINTMAQRGVQERLEMQQTKIQEMDEAINKGIAIHQVVDEDESIIKYYENGALVARDIFKKDSISSNELKSREYYSNDQIIAIDSFGMVKEPEIPGVVLEGVVKQRVYYNQDGRQFLEYFDKDGLGSPKKVFIVGNKSLLRPNSMRSPFPPPYFILYR